MDIFISFFVATTTTKLRKLFNQSRIMEINCHLLLCNEYFPFPACSGEETDYDVTYDDNADYEEEPEDYADY